MRKNISHARQNQLGNSGKQQLVTARQRNKMAEMAAWLINQPGRKMTARQLAEHTGRQNGFWYEVAKGNFSTIRPTIQDYNDLCRVFKIAKRFDGQRGRLLECALEVSKREAELILAVQRLLDEATRLKQ